MRISLVISALVHVAIIGLGSLAFPVARPFEVEPMKVLPVDIVEASELTRLKAGVKDAEEKEAETPKPGEAQKAEDAEKTNERKRMAALPPPPPPQPEAPKAATPPPLAQRPQPRAQEKKSEPEPVPAKAEAEPKEMSDNELKKEPPPLPPVRPAHVPRPALQPKADKEPNFDADRIAALLNKIPTDQAPAGGQPAVPEPPSAGDPRGLDARMSLSELDALRAQISPCWSPPIGVQGAADLVVQLRLALNTDGTLTRPPEILTSGSGLAFLAAADSARRAVLRCQPYELPAEKYDAWRDIKVNFDPREMLGG